MKIVITCSCAVRWVPLVSSAYSRAISGANNIAIAVRTVSTDIATVKSAAVAWSSRFSRCSTKSGTRVAESTPPRISS